MNNCFLNLSRRFCSTKIPPKVCIVGAGPAGFYSAQHLIKNVPNIQIDIIERLPVPFGLVRYGVAPDHPEVKNVINTFTKTAQHPNVRFIGNVNLGDNISLKHLQEAYNVILLSYGADKDRTLNIPGEDLENVISARRIVGWYNGFPYDNDLNVDLSGSTAVIIGQGNVAIDVARILLTPIDILRKTDITEHSLEVLSKSKLSKIYLVGRRGPLQAAFTIKELREMLKLPNTQTIWQKTDFDGVSDHVDKLPRPRKRITELMLNSLKSQTEKPNTKMFLPKFYRSPKEFLGENKVKKVILTVNKMKDDDITSSTAVSTDKIEELDCDLAIRSIGYKSIAADQTLPFNPDKGVVKNDHGKVTDNIYTAGWLATGPTGVILTTMSNAFDISNSLAHNFNNQDIVAKPGFEMLKQLLRTHNVPIVTWKGWEKIDAYEQEQGKKLGKPREKIVDLKKMLEIGSETL